MAQTAKRKEYLFKCLKSAFRNPHSKIRNWNDHFFYGWQLSLCDFNLQIGVLSLESTPFFSK